MNFSNVIGVLKLHSLEGINGRSLEMKKRIYWNRGSSRKDSEILEIWKLEDTWI